MRLLISNVCFGFACLSLTACSSADWDAVNTCEKFIKDNLRSPSSYEKQEAVWLEGTSEKHGKSVRTLLVTYDADNAFGAAIRGGERCHFEVDDEGNFVADFDFARVIATADRALGKRSECCVRTPSNLEGGAMASEAPLGEANPEMPEETE